MNSQKFDLIIFDCDGTLTDSEYVNNQAFIDVLNESGFSGYTLEHAYANWVGTTVSSICLAIQMETGRVLPSDIVLRYIARVTELQTTSLKALDGALDLVMSASKKLKICVASNGERSNVLNSLVLTGLMPHFTEETVFTKVQVKNAKPAPDLFLFAAAKMGVEPSRCLVIEDSAAGVTAGVAAGMTTFGITAAAHEPQKQAQTLKAAGAQEVFPALIHIREQLGL